MNPRPQRLLFLSAALLVGLLFFGWIWKRGPDSPDPQAPEQGGKKPLTAIQKRDGQTLPDPGPAVGAIEATPFNLLSGKTALAVTPDQIEGALDGGGRQVEGLIAAQAILGDYSYLREAAERHADDPRTQFWIVANRVLPEKRTEWLEKFKESDPDNAMANFLAAEDAFRSNDYEAGIAELRASAGKGYRDYSDDLRNEVRDLYSATKLFDEEVALSGSANVSAMPHVEQVQGLAQRLIEYQQALSDQGDAEGATEVVDLGMAMLETVAGNSDLDAIGARTMMLFMQENLQQAAGDPGGQLAGLSAERERLAGLGESVRQILAREELLAPDRLAGYAERLHSQGEVAAAEWLVEEVGELPPADPE